MALRGQVSCPNLDQMVWEGKEEREGDKRERGRKERDFRERSSTVSLDFPVIGPANSGEARSKFSPHSKGYTWVPVLGSFDKLRKGRGFILLDLLSF